MLRSNKCTFRLYPQIPAIPLCTLLHVWAMTFITLFLVCPEISSSPLILFLEYLYMLTFIYTYIANNIHDLYVAWNSLSS